MKRQVASKHDSRDYVETIEKTCGVQLGIARSAQVEIVEPGENVRFVIVEGKYTFVEQPGAEGIPSLFIPFVGSQSALALFPSVRIDEGAVKYIIKGADVMRPGIVKYDDWGAKDKLVVVRDDVKARGLAVGRTLVESREMALISRGACVKNLHRAGDRVWESYKKM